MPARRLLPRLRTSPAGRAIAEGDRARDARRWAEAAQAYARALKLEPANAAIWVQHGHALKESGRTDEAEAAYRTALQLEPATADTYLQLGHLLKVTRRPNAAAAAYLEALRLGPDAPDAAQELSGLLRMDLHGLPRSIREALLGLDEPLGLASAAAGARTALSGLLEQSTDLAAADAFQAALAQIDRLTPARAPETGAPALVFDVSDLVAYFDEARLPTGIQRVQMEVICGLLRNGAAAGEVRVCCFGELRDDWSEIPAAHFLRLCDLALSDGDRRQGAWVAALLRLRLLIETAPPFEFPFGALLINLGTSWWLQNYFLHVRRAKAERGVRYVPFVHDLIPVMAPQHCIRQLTQDFISWLLGVFAHADAFLANSHATVRDLVEVAERLGEPLDRDAVSVIPLDGDARRPAAAALEPDLLKRWRLEPGGFVLFVSTIESRKNHLGAFAAWEKLIREHGAGRIPKLVCVGAAGWLNDAVHARLAASEALRGKVLMLAGLSEPELGLLYRQCRFTLYPSHYEGWGLPVTESLCHGKVPLVSTASSLPEAGGEFAEYFEAGSDAELTRAAQRLIFDDAYRVRREGVIASAFRPRPWADIGGQIAGALRARLAAPAAWPDAPTPPLGVFHPIARNAALRIWRGMAANEIYRAGAGWWWPDDWGVWTKPGGGEVALRIAGPHGRMKLYLGLQGLRRAACGWRIEVTHPQGVQAEEGRLGVNETRWIALDLPPGETDTRLCAHITGDGVQDLAAVSDGLDRRETSIGWLGFYLCEAADAAARTDFLEALTLGTLERLAPREGGQP